MGAGASTRLSAVRWGLAGNIVVAWLITIPAAALVGAAVEYATSIQGGAAVAVALAALLAATAFAASRRDRLASIGATNPA